MKQNRKNTFLIVVLFKALALIGLILYWGPVDLITSSNTDKYTTTTLEPKTIKKYANPHDYNLLLNPDYDLCGNNLNKSLLLIVFVVLPPESFHKRLVIRSSWGNTQLSSDFKVIFATGLSKNKTINQRLKFEFETYKDIIQEDFYDSYYNLTAKIIMSYKWISKYCSNAQFTLRLNDDVVVNTIPLLKFLENYKKMNPNALRNKVMGVCHHQPAVSRNRKNKFYVSKEQLSQDFYDDYCEGSAYILTTDLTKTYYELSLDLYKPPFSDWLEDAYMGMLGKKVNTHLVQISGHFTPWSQYLGYSKQKKLELINNHTLFLFEKDDVFLFWYAFNNFYFKAK